VILLLNVYVYMCDVWAGTSWAERSADFKIMATRAGVSEPSVFLWPNPGPLECGILYSGAGGNSKFSLHVSECVADFSMMTALLSMSDAIDKRADTQLIPCTPQNTPFVIVIGILK